MFCIFPHDQPHLAQLQNLPDLRARVRRVGYPKSLGKCHAGALVFHPTTSVHSTLGGQRGHRGRVFLQRENDPRSLGTRSGERGV